MGVFSDILSIVASWSKHFASKDQVRKRKEKDLEKRVTEMNSAIEEGDVDKVNERLRNHTMKIIVLCGTLLLCGCGTTEIRYVPESQKAVPMTHHGAEGWFVPNGVFSIISEKADRYDEIQKEKNK